MANYITIDGGTSNTRISLVVKNDTVDRLTFHIGAKKGIDDKEILIQTIKQGIDTILKNNSMPESKIEKILASGMITGEFGLVNLPYITAPVGIEELHNSLYETRITEISPIPFVFVPGVKKLCESFEHSDIMRGEETEFIGLFRGEGIYILPGSHSKIIIADTNQRIIKFETTLTGEFISSICQNTILKDSLSLKNAKLDYEFLLKGYDVCKENGINASLFKVRILDKLFTQNKTELYSFFMGVVLCNEVEQILRKNPKRIIVGGQKEIKQAIAVILKKISSAHVEIIDDWQAEQASSSGIIKIYEYSNDENVSADLCLF